jgi:accessory Sec system S-layer assembly protein
MFKLLDRFKKGSKKIQGEESSISSSEFMDQETTDSISGETVKTAMSIHPDSKLTQEDHYYFQFLHNDLPDLKQNQLSLAGIELKKDDEALYVIAFVRNSLSKAIKLGQTPLLLIGPDGENIASKEFDLSSLGEIPANSSRPWQFVFPVKDVKISEIPVTGWKLAFELKASHKLDLDESWEQSMASEEISKLEKLVSTLQAPKQGEVNFMGLKAAIDNDSLNVTLLIRNGSKKDINLQQLPLVVEDASGTIIAQGGFTFNEFRVRANTSKPWTFIFPETLLKNKEPDLSKWKTYPLTK